MDRRQFVSGLVAAPAVLIGSRAARAAEPVDLELSLAADGSGSIDDDELELQRKGYADAIQSAQVLSAIMSGPIGAVAITYFEWGSSASQVVIVDWTVVKDAASAAAFAEALITRPRGAWGYNSISAAIDFAVRRTEANAFDGTRKVIDVSGDGPNIGGRDIETARDEAVAKGFTINALAIIRPGGTSFRGPIGESLASYYERTVIGGPGAFVQRADETTSFADAVRKKMVLEIAAAPGMPQPMRTGLRGG